MRVSQDTFCVLFTYLHTVKFFNWQVAREGNLQRFEIPMDVKLVAGRRDLLNAIVRLYQMTKYKQRADEMYSRFSNLNAEEKESDEGNVLDRVLHFENLEAGEYSSIGRVLLSTYSKLLTQQMGVYNAFTLQIRSSYVVW